MKRRAQADIGGLCPRCGRWTCKVAEPASDKARARARRRPSPDAAEARAQCEAYARAVRRAN